MDAPDAVALRDRAEHVQPRGDPAEDRVGAVEVRLGRVGDEELAAARVGAGERHAHSTRLVAHRIHLVAQHDAPPRSEEHTSELQSRENLVCRLLLEKKKNIIIIRFQLYKKTKKK